MLANLAAGAIERIGASSPEFRRAGRSPSPRTTFQAPHALMVAQTVTAPWFGSDDSRPVEQGDSTFSYGFHAVEPM